MINTVIRKEKKFLLTLQEAKKQENIMSSILNLDKHSKGMRLYC